jgi:hypothetical protein
MDHRLYLDIETVPSQKFKTDPPSEESCRVEPKPPAKNLKAADKIAAAIEKNKETARQASIDNYVKACLDHEKHFRSYSLRAWKSQIASISWAWNDGEVDGIIELSERDVLIGFFTKIATYMRHNNINGFLWCGHNIKGFDLKVLQARAMMNQVVPKRFEIPWDQRPWNNDLVIDTMDVLPFTNNDRKRLSDLCRYLDIDGKSASGSEVYDMYCCGQFDELLAYNKRDVEITRMVFDKLGL